MKGHGFGCRWFSAGGWRSTATCWASTAGTRRTECAPKPTPAPSPQHPPAHTIGTKHMSTVASQERKGGGGEEEAAVGAAAEAKGEGAEEFAEKGVVVGAVQPVMKTNGVRACLSLYTVQTCDLRGGGEGGQRTNGTARTGYAVFTVSSVRSRGDIRHLAAASAARGRTPVRPHRHQQTGGLLVPKCRSPEVWPRQLHCLAPVGPAIGAGLPLGADPGPTGGTYRGERTVRCCSHGPPTAHNFFFSCFNFGDVVIPGLEEGTWRSTVAGLTDGCWRSNDSGHRGSTTTRPAHPPVHQVFLGVSPKFEDHYTPAHD